MRRGPITECCVGPSVSLMDIYFLLIIATLNSKWLNSAIDESQFVHHAGIPDTVPRSIHRF